jgi:hypothetical protein
MTTGAVIEVRRSGVSEGRAPIPTPTDPQGRYERLLGLVLRMGSWLSGPEARLLPEREWERLFARYQEQLDEVRRLGDMLRPVSLRDRDEPLSGDALVSEVAELFAA